jgi:hypothetical protein
VPESSKNPLDARLSYREKVSLSETASLWQSLAFGPNYKAAYCLAVCPAGEDVLRPFLTDRRAFLQDIVRPLTEKEETVYVIHGSDAEEYTPRRFPKKRKVKRVGSGIRATSIAGFLLGLKLLFQLGKAVSLNAVYHFTFTGKEPKEAAVTIRVDTVQVEDGHEGEADLQITADSETWLSFLAKDRSLLWALLRRKIRIKGSPKLLLVFGKCFPSGERFFSTTRLASERSSTMLNERCARYWRRYDGCGGGRGARAGPVASGGVAAPAGGRSVADKGVTRLSRIRPLLSGSTAF